MNIKTIHGFESCDPLCKDKHVAILEPMSVSCLASLVESKVVSSPLFEENINRTLETISLHLSQLNCLRLMEPVNAHSHNVVALAIFDYVVLATSYTEVEAERTFSL